MLKSLIAQALEDRGLDVYATELSVDVPETGPVWVQFFPAGKFRTTDGRPEELPHFLMDDIAAKAIIADLAARKNPRPVDYEHQIVLSEENGKEAPASGWFGQIKWVPGDGLYALVDWSARARGYIRAGEYKFISPVFSIDKKTGRPLRVKHAALTNTPAIDGMDAVIATEIEPEGVPVKELLLKLLGLTAEASDEDVVAKVTSLKSEKETVDAEVIALREKEPDAAKFVPMADHKALQEEVVKLRGAGQLAEVDTIVAKALDDGRLLKKQEAWARKLGSENLVALKEFVESAETLTPGKGTQTDGKAPPASGGKLTEEELYVCKQLRKTPEEFLKLKEIN